jgi:hypothetical protein
VLRPGHREHLQFQLGDHFQRDLPVSRRGFTVCKLHALLSSTDCHHSVCSFVILFIEIPLLLRICPTSPSFDAFIRKFATNYTRAAIYLVMSIVQWLSLIVKTTSLIAPAILLLFAAAFYALAGIKGQQFQSSKTLGGQGVAQMIV